MGSVGKSVASTVTNVVHTVTQVVTNPAKANLGQIVSIVNPTVAALPTDAIQHPEDRVGVAALTVAAVGGAYVAGVSGAATGGTGAAATLGLAKSPSIPQAIQAIDTVATGGGGSGPVQPPSGPVQGPVAPSDFGVWSTGSGSGSGNIYANPVASGTTSPTSMMTTYLVAVGAFLLVLSAMMQKKRA